MPYSSPYRRGDGEYVLTPEGQFKHYGVLAIEAELSRFGWLDSDRVNGIYGRRTEWAVRKFQKHHSLDDDGIAGFQTLDALFAPLVGELGMARPAGLFRAVLLKESRFDPGAHYNNGDSVDQGMCMLNSNAYPELSEANAFNPVVAIPIAANRLKAAWKRYAGTGVRLECTIASYNSPAGAEALSKGEPISEKLQGYIADVKGLM